MKQIEVCFVFWILSPVFSFLHRHYLDFYVALPFMLSNTALKGHSRYVDLRRCFGLLKEFVGPALLVVQTVPCARAPGSGGNMMGWIQTLVTFPAPGPCGLFQKKGSHYSFSALILNGPPLTNSYEGTVCVSWQPKYWILRKGPVLYYGVSKSQREDRLF